MTAGHRHAAFACLAGAGVAFAAALAIGGARVLTVVHDLLEIYAGDRGDPIAAPDFRVAALVALAALLALAAAALALAGWRAARALERASLIDVAA
jgi:hypothetical protein